MKLNVLYGLMCIECKYVLAGTESLEFKREEWRQQHEKLDKPTSSSDDTDSSN